MQKGFTLRQHGYVIYIISTLLSVLTYNTPASALTYQSKLGVSFNLNSSLSLSVSGDLLIDNLTPGTFSDSNTIQVTVNTNNAYGYKLTATVGNTSNSSSELRHSNYSTSGDPIFSSIGLTADLARSSFSSGTTYDDKWGYSLNGTTYNGLPVEGSNDEPVTILSSNYVPTNGTASSNFLIGAKASSNKASGDYTNVINFYLVANAIPDFLYDKVAEMSKGKMTDALLKTEIETPTTTSYLTDTSNSGVYEYDAQAFGPSSDISTTSKIYIYRGVLENNPGTHSSITYPNYVVLNDLCWRIVRTTGSGGIKMIYSGYHDISGNCVHDSLETMAFNANSQNGTIVHGGYTYNSNYVAPSSANGVATDTVFGGNANVYLNNTRSTIKTYLEDSWYPNNLSNYTNMLESSAGYCNDRSYYGSSSGTTIEEIVSTVNGTSGRFGARNRIFGSNPKGPTLNCTRGEVDLFHYVISTSASSGHEYTGNELKYPVALLTPDEAVFAGAGVMGSSSPFAKNTNVYLSLFTNSEEGFWLLSPATLISGLVLYYTMSINTLSHAGSSATEIDVRPVISLKAGTVVTGGTGTITDPWTVE